MASGYIYLISNHDAFPSWYKVGRTKDFLQRFNQYRQSMPSVYGDSWEIEGLWKVNDCKAAEEYTLRGLRGWKLEQDRLEWFKSQRRDGIRMAKFIEERLIRKFDGVPLRGEGDAYRRTEEEEEI